MQIKILKLTDESLMRRACEMTFSGTSNMTLEKIYKCRHSPIRTQLFYIEMFDIPTFASTHLVRHNVGVTHYVKSNREDRHGYTGDTGRNHPVNHAMLINAEALQNICHKRLCGKAHVTVQEIMGEIKSHMEYVDEHLARALVPLCVWRGGLCDELKPCGRNRGMNNE